MYIIFNLIDNSMEWNSIYCLRHMCGKKFSMFISPIPSSISTDNFLFCFITIVLDFRSKLFYEIM